MKNGKASLGILAGIATGAALGMLFAPKKGSMLRKAIVRKGEDLLDTVSEEIEEKYEELKHHASHVLKGVKTH